MIALIPFDAESSRRIKITHLFMRHGSYQSDVKLGGAVHLNAIRIEGGGAGSSCATPDVHSTPGFYTFAKGTGLHDGGRWNQANFDSSSASAA